MTELKSLRTSKGLTQQAACALLGVSLRSYKEYENTPEKRNTLKFRSMLSSLESYVPLDEEHGILSVERIRTVCKDVLSEYNVKYAILFGSYAKGCPTEKSDVDLLISTDVTGLRFFGIAERLREALCKNVDLLDLGQLRDNQALLDEILKDGIRIYEQK